MKKFMLWITVLTVILSCTNSNQNSNVKQTPDRDTTLLLSNGYINLGVNIFGGAYSHLSFKGDSVNPFSWYILPEDMPENNKAGAPFEGHFLCLGRWGSPTKGEIEAGVPHNGEATNTWWDIENKSKNSVVMTNEAQLDGLFIKREIELYGDKPAYFVKEEISNINTVGRLNNVVQHATIGAPFLDTSTIINSNAEKGFLQKLSYPDPHKYEYNWPLGIIDSIGTQVDFRETKTKKGYVTTHIYDDKYGWITAYNPELGTMLGYIWRTDEYKWSNVWHAFIDGKPWSKGLEFGTTGIGKSYQDLLAVDTKFHGIPSFHFLDAGEKLSKSFICFYIKAGKNKKGVDDISFSEGRASVKMKGVERFVFSIGLKSL